MAEIEVSGEQLTVWVADQPHERRQGLREIEELPPGIEGMLFVYDLPAIVSFGMLDTRMELDIWFFDTDGVLLGTADMEPCPELPCPDYASPGPVAWVLETLRGERQFAPKASISTVVNG